MTNRKNKYYGYMYKSRYIDAYLLHQNIQHGSLLFLG